MVEEKTALRLIYLDVTLYSVGSVVGSMHHVYFPGEPVEHTALGAVFSAARRPRPVPFEAFAIPNFEGHRGRRPNNAGVGRGRCLSSTTWWHVCSYRW